MEQFPIILFDGVCNLCDKSVQFIIKNDKKKHFRFAALQSNAGQRLLTQYGISTTELNSFILIYNNQVYNKSSGALHVAKLLGGGWIFFYSLIIIPKFLRDSIYDFISEHRYKWFGKKEACMIPTPELKARFLND